MLTLFLHLIAAFSLNATAEVPLPPSGLDYRVDASVTYFTSQENYTSGGGELRSLANGGYFTDIIGKALYTQDLDKAQRVYGGLTYSQTESSNGVNTRTNSGVNEVLAGGQWWFNFNPYKIVAAGDLVYPLFRVDPNGDDALLGEGAMKARLGGWFIYPIGNLKPFGYLGYEYRDEGRSHAIPYSIGAHYKIRDLWLQGEYRGYEKLFDNADSENRNQRDTFLQKVSGGSYRYYAINPAMSEIAGSVGYTLGTFTIYGEAAYMVNGSSVASGLTFMLGASFSPAGRITDSPDEFEERARPRSRRSSEPINESLPPDDDGFMAEPDPRMAPPPSPPPEPPPPPPPPTGGEASDSGGGNVQLEMRKAPRAPAPKAKPKAPPKPRTKKDKIDKMLKNTEKTLQGL